MNTQMTTATDIAYKAVGDYLLPVIALPESTGLSGTSEGSERPF